MSRSKARGPSNPNPTEYRLAAVLDLFPLALVDSSLNLDQHLQTLVERIRSVLNADAVMIMVQGEDEGFLDLRAHAESENLANTWPIEWREHWPIDWGLVGWVMRTGESALVADMREDSRGRATRLAPESIIAAPLLVHDRPIGVLRVSALDPGRFQESDQRLVEALASATAIVAENARLSNELHQHTQELEARYRAVRMLGDTASAVLESTGASRVVDLILEKAREVGPFDMGSIYLVRTTRLDRVAWFGFENDTNATPYYPIDSSHRRRALFHVLTSREPLVIDNVQD